MDITWKDGVGLQEGKQIPIKIAEINGHKDRFLLWPVMANINMYCLFDNKTSEQQWLTKEEAEPRIVEVITKED